MKTKRYVAAVAVVLAISGCSGDVTAPGSTLRAPDSPHSAAAAVDNTPAATEPAPATLEPDATDNGSTGSGCCSSNR